VQQEILIALARQRRRVALDSVETARNARRLGRGEGGRVNDELEIG